MKKIGLVGVVAGALTAAVVGFAGPAQADATVLAFGYGSGSGIYDNDSNYPWRDQLVPRVYVPHVDTSVHN